MKQKLNKNILLEEFENNYWYIYELKSFLKEIGLKNNSKLRKDEIEKIITEYIKHKIIPTIEKSISTKGNDVLELSCYVNNFKSNKETKEFLLNESKKLYPKLKIKSGSSYWLNRWIEIKKKTGVKIKYKDIVEEYIKLNLSEEKLPQIPSTKMNNFIMDFLKNENGAKRKDAIDEWKKLKELNIPKNYKSWKKNKAKD